MNNRVLNRIAGSIWAMPEGNLREMLEIAVRVRFDTEGAKLAREAREQNKITLSGGGFSYLEGSYDMRVNSDGIGYMAVSGPMFKKANLLTEMSGATSTEMMARDFRLAMSSPNVKGILIDWDTPGGEVGGTEEFANLIYAARGIKPVVSFVSGLACSGGQWGVSGSALIVATRSSLMGSIGVAASFVDSKKQDEMIGLEEITILSSNASKKRPDPATPEGAEQIQATLNDLEKVFISSVARNYGVSEQHVIDNFGQGDIIVGDRALELGLIHKIGFQEDAMDELLQMIESQGENSIATPPPLAQVKTNLMEHTENNPALVAGENPGTPPTAVTGAPAAVKVPAITPDNVAQFDPKALKIAGYYAATSGVEARLTPEAREALIPLHAAMQSVGMDEHLEAFVAEIKPMALTTDVLPAPKVKGSKVAIENKKGQSYVDPLATDEGEEDTEFDADAYVDGFIEQANKARN